MKEYRADKIKLECLMAFTVTDDQARQMKVFKACRAGKRITPTTSGAFLPKR